MTEIPAGQPPALTQWQRDLQQFFPQPVAGKDPWVLRRAKRKRFSLPAPAEFRHWVRTERELCEPRVGVRELALMTQMSKSRINRIETGVTVPSLEAAWRIWLVLSLIRRGRLDPATRRIIKGWRRI